MSTRKNKKLNVALIGCGGMASNYRHLYNEMAGAKLALLIDIDEKLLNNIAAKLNVENWSTDFNECLKPNIDIVDISTPNFLHEKQAVAALKANKHVILQKPITANLQQAENIEKAAKKTKAITGMYMNMRDNPVYYDVKEIIKSDRLGNISSVYCRNAHTGGLKIDANNWHSLKEKTGGGSLIQLGIHNINILQWLLGARIISVMGYSKNMMCPNIGGDDVTNAVCEFENGVLGTIESAYCAEGNLISIQGTKGFLTIHRKRPSLEMKLQEEYKGEIINYNKPGELLITTINQLEKYLFNIKNPYDQHIAFVNAVREKKEPPVSVEQGLYDLKIVKRIYESAEQKKMIKI